LETQYSFTPKFSAFTGVLAEALPSTVKNSPMNDGKYRVEGTAGLMYRF
jgi:mltA-interacting protein mipA